MSSELFQKETDVRVCMQDFGWLIILYINKSSQIRLHLI
jgi:hypothetical protein